ncbi:ABC transporter permease [Microbacterium elymi]|uniref:ABC transporter permease n=1 Tax=Microbacterium elymi TaxID=2909587 RepID=A0ABY5NLC5_9MICO|nr:ABC transporter permease [Microbacterium elymi]UUT35967.1 ABC transporter permease [Microbacterium elymi]
MRRVRLPGFILAVPAWLWLLAFFVAPVLVVFWYSLGYKPGLFATHANDKLSLDRYAEVLTPTFFDTFWNTLWIGIAGTLLCFLIGAPVAYWMALKAPARMKGLLIALVLVPFWTNFLVRTIGWMVILSPEGWISHALQAVGLAPLDILYTRPAVLFGVVYNYLPLMILPLFVAFDRVELSVREASKDLGANRWRTFARVTFPLARPGIIVGALLVYIPLMGDYITATVLGGAKGNMVGQLVASQFQTAQNWALGSAMAVMLILIILGSVALMAGIIWLLALPMRMRNRVTIQEVAA